MDTIKWHDFSIRFSPASHRSTVGTEKRSPGVHPWGARAVLRWSQLETVLERSLDVS
jgi:hypothetical protein